MLVVTSVLLAPPALASEGGPLPMPADYEGAYALECTHAELGVEVFASRGVLGLDADLHASVAVPLGCEGVDDQELRTFARQGVLGCMALSDDPDTCEWLTAAITESIEDLNADLGSLVPEALVLTSRLTPQPTPRIVTWGQHGYEDGHRRTWSYDLDPISGNFEHLGLRAPRLEVAPFEELGMSCETFGATDLTGQIRSQQGELYGGIEARPTAICTQQVDGEDLVLELFATFHGSVEGLRVGPDVDIGSAF